MNWKEFKPTILFLVKFLGSYLIGNLLYGWFVTSYVPNPDPATYWVTAQSALVLTHAGWPAEALSHVATPTTSIMFEHKAIVSVYEGCNGLNIAIIFLGFLLAFGPLQKQLLWFVPLGLAIIHISNILRIVLLFLVTLYLPHYIYFTHKYLFTAIIYAVVFLMWLIWVRMNRKRST